MPRDSAVSHTMSKRKDGFVKEQVYSVEPYEFVALMHTFVGCPSSSPESILDSFLRSFKFSSFFCLEPTVCHFSIYWQQKVLQSGQLTLTSPKVNFLKLGFSIFDT